MEVGAAAEVVVEEAVADRGQRGGGNLAVGRNSESEPGARRFEDAVEVGGAEEVALGSGGAAHRLLVDGKEGGALGGSRLGAGDEADRVAAPQVLVDLVAVTAAALARQGGIGDLDDVALAGAVEGRVGEG